MGNKRNDWHTGAYVALRLDLIDDWNSLIFEDEYQLTDQPLKVDMIVLKKSLITQ